MKLTKLGPLLALSVVFLQACSGDIPYQPASPVLPAHIKNIAIRRPIINRTTQIGLEDNLYTKVYDEFTRDGRFNITDEASANGILVMEITYYTLQPIVYAATGEAQQYKLRILLNTYFVDTVNNVTLWEEPNFEGFTVYLANTADSINGMSEDDARNVIWDILVQKVYKRVFEGFGATGIPDKKVPLDTSN